MRGAPSADLLVIGAGPAGTAAAITAANRGRAVVVVDKAMFPRDKTCGDGLTAGALRLLDRLGLLLTELSGYTPVQEAILVSPSGRHLRLPLPDDCTHAAVVPRAELDAALVDLARSRGVTVLEGRAVAGAKTDGEGVEAALCDGEVLRAPWAVAADGHWSVMRRLLEPHRAPALGEWAAFRQYFSGVDDPRLCVLFEKDLLPGYAWVFPLSGGRANVGLGMPRGPGITGKVLKARWNDLLARPTLREVLGPGARPEAAMRAWPIPTHLDPAALVHGRVLFAGDAAGVADPMTGEGIAQALETGVLAARSVTTGGDVAEGYRHAVERALGRDLRFAALLQRVLAHSLGARGAIRAVDLNDWTRRSFARWMFEDYPRAVLFTPSRWRRHVFTPPGAYAGSARW